MSNSRVETGIGSTDTPINLEASDTFETIDNEEVQAPKKKRRTSPIWEHFDLIEINGVEMAKCKYCKTTLTAKGRSGTSHLHDHFSKSCSGRKQLGIKQTILNMKRAADGSIHLEGFEFNQEASRRLLAKMIVLHEYP